MTLATEFVEYTKPLTSRDTWEDTVSGWGIDTGNDEPESVLAEIVDRTRWAVIHRQVFRFADGSHVEVHYSSPATEQQDQDPACEWVEVVPWSVVTTIFAKVGEEPDLKPGMRVRIEPKEPTS